jgi:hypothetical protein
MSYQVRLADPAEARTRLLPLWTTNLTVEGEPTERLRWFYCDGPHGSGQTFVLERERGRGAAIGGAGLGSRVMRYRGAPLKTAVFADLAIDPAHRSGFPALALVRAIRDHTRRMFDLGYGFPNEKAVPLYRRAGYLELGVMSRYTRVLRSGRYLEQRIGMPSVARAVGAVADRALAASARLRAGRANTALELRWLEDFDARFDTLWDEAWHAHPILCERTCEFLRWRFSRQPARQYRIAALVEPGSERLVAYAIVRDASGTAQLADLFGPGMPELDWLLRKLLPELAARGFTAATMRFMGTPRLPELLASHGFARRKDTRTVVLALGDEISGMAAADLRDPSAWYVTDLDEDF